MVRHFDKFNKFSQKSTLSRRGFLQRSLIGAGAGLGCAAVGLKFIDKANAEVTGKLNFLTWNTYLGETTLDDFKAEKNIAVEASFFSGDDELFNIIKKGNHGLDLIVPSGNVTKRLISEKLIQPLNYTKIPNSVNISKLFTDADFDKLRQYSICFMWGTTGIGYRKSKIDGVPTWKDLFDSDKYAGRIGLFDGTTTLHMVSKYLGYGMNPENPDHIEAAVKLMLKQDKNIKLYHQDDGQDFLLSGEIDIVHEFNGDIAQIQVLDKDIGYVIPDIGGEVWQDNLAIPVEAVNIEEAHQFINYLLEPKVNAKIAEDIQYASPNLPARALMNKSYRENPTIFPEVGVIMASESNMYINDEIETLLQSGWERIRALAKNKA